MYKLFLFILVSTHIFAGTINIAVAANVSYAMDELKIEFAKTNPDTKVQVTLGSSGKLTAQIKNGAPYGLFMSANIKYPLELYNSSFTITEPIVYAKGTLAYFSVRKQDFSDAPNLLKSKKIKKIAVANPKTAPYGEATFKALKNAQIYDDIKAKFVYGESISQTISFSVIAADIGIVAKSALYSKKMSRYKKNINWVELDPKLYTPIEQGIILLKSSKNKKEYKAFYDFILSKRAKKIFERYGYII